MKTQTEIQKLRAALSILMEERGLTQLDVCRETGVTQSAVSLFLSGRRGLNGDAALRLARFLGSGQPPPASQADGRPSAPI